MSLPEAAPFLSRGLLLPARAASSRSGEVMLLPPGHDAWTVGDQACTFVEFSKGNDYYG